MHVCGFDFLSPLRKAAAIMKSSAAPTPLRAPLGTAPRSPLPWAAGVLMLIAAPVSGGGQVPPPSQAQGALQQAVQQNPGPTDVVRQRILQSGLSAEQVRARLAASGYPSNLLDAYLSGTVSGAALPASALELAAIQALGVPPIEQSLLSVDTGLIRMRGTNVSSRVFGVDVFRRTTTQFLPLLSGPVPPDYKLGPGDALVLILTGDVELAYTLQVTREGFILIPQVGQVFVANLALEQLRDVLYTRLGRVYSGVKRGANASTRFDVSVANVRANQVYVVGEVSQPGAYQISSLGTVLTALYAAGGATERADMREVGLQRPRKLGATPELYDYLLRGDVKSDVRLQTGDVVFVPVHGTRAEVEGAVTRPAVYELKAGETVTDLVHAAGGVRPVPQPKRLAGDPLPPVPDRSPGSPPRAVIDIPLTPLSLGSGERGAVPPRAPPLPVPLAPIALE